MATSPRSVRDSVNQDVEDLLFPLVKSSQVLAVFLAPDDFAVVWGNDAFWHSVPTARDGRPFEHCLTLGAGEIFKQNVAEIVSQPLDIELHHPVPGGVRIVTYRFVKDAAGNLAGFGVDRSEEMEMIHQMAAMLEELEVEINQRIELTNQLEQIAITDPLTGLYNRRQFDTNLEQEWTRCQRYGARFALVMLDIDHFKSVNDTYGHQRGDEVLKNIAYVLRRSFRTGDTVARVGGEEFAVIALEVDETMATTLAERVRTTVEALELPEVESSVTVSLGVTTTDAAVSSSQHLVRIADSNLYRAKEGGRNRVVASLD